MISTPVIQWLFQLLCCNEKGRSACVTNTMLFCRLSQPHYFIRLGTGPRWCSWWAPRRQRVTCDRGQRCGGFQRAPCQHQECWKPQNLGGSTSCLEFVLWNWLDWLHGCSLGYPFGLWQTFCWSTKWNSPRGIQREVSFIYQAISCVNVLYFVNNCNLALMKVGDPLKSQKLIIYIHVSALLLFWSTLKKNSIAVMS